MSTLLKGLSLLITLAALAVNAHAHGIISPYVNTQITTHDYGRAQRRAIATPAPNLDVPYQPAYQVPQDDGTGQYQPGLGRPCYRVGNMLHCN